MEDEKIVALYWERSEAAIEETQRKYGRYCRSIAFRILRSEEDAEECESDAYLKTWDAIPPHRPSRLSTFIGKITRRIALDRLEKQTAAKRLSHGELVYDELADCLSDTKSDTLADEIALRDVLNTFLSSLEKRDRVVFMQRYWYFLSVSEIASALDLSVSNVKVILHRTRNSLKQFLAEETFFYGGYNETKTDPSHD